MYELATLVLFELGTRALVEVLSSASARLWRLECGDSVRVEALSSMSSPSKEFRRSECGKKPRSGFSAVTIRGIGLSGEEERQRA